MIKDQRHKNWIISNLLPLAVVRTYAGKGQWSIDNSYLTSRFIKERTSDIVRRPIAGVGRKTHPSKRIAFTFHQAIISAMHECPEVYDFLENLGQKIESEAAKYISSCDHAVVQMTHRSITDDLLIHTHRLTEKPMYTMVYAVKITSDDPSFITANFYPPIPDDNPNLEKFIQLTSTNLEYVRGKSPEKITLGETTTLLFNAAYTPHNANFSDDIMVYFIYDNVEFKRGAFEKIKLFSQVELFRNFPETKRVYMIPYLLT